MKIQKIALLAMMLVTFATGCGDGRDYSGVIATAMQSRKQAYDTACTVIHDHNRTIIQVSLPTFASEMRKIDVSECPGDFRDAWKDYLDTVDNAVRKNESFGYVSLGGGEREQWAIPLDHNGVEYQGVWGALSGAVDAHPAPPKPN